MHANDWQGREAGVMWDADLSTKAADPRLACEFAGVGGGRATRSLGKLLSVAASRTAQLDAWRLVHGALPG